MDELWKKKMLVVAKSGGGLTYRFEHCHQRFLILSDDTHDRFASDAETALDITDFHGESQHSRQTERYSLWVLFTMHRHFEAIAKIDVDDLASDAVKHQVRRMSVTKPKNVSHH